MARGYEATLVNSFVISHGCIDILLEFYMYVGVQGDRKLCTLAKTEAATTGVL